ncbi:serine/threonine-protein kinase [Amycolatopsis bartoniae]|uniref:non-specific serine/threonine protein kinase n=1 Tax=Amycolatopsis bartoniae TaxID=941986 RepID=A0A8H9IYW8_9PSEU|nr:Stk1 family PASTA domain-containing Ser/Thr kinase [Amycolatopsis bartoniae]MBB2933997.1 serine/threonine-protein kinase [Amycolatopsis bartoniae]TVT00222.1 Stk1 family PASTA domain-containing Ser/Thr kinase [Amycolatopsis bartoniae]GHF86030.1 serine/threonine protein kinase [Amycolatopsis bartoniae]
MTTTDTGLAGTLLERRYRVDSPIARGGMSSVYRGADTRLDRPVAIKIMDPRFADDRSFVERFEREARSAARLHHPNVVTVHDQGFDGDHVFLVMELVDGGTLRDLLDERGRLEVPLAIAVAEQMLAALSAAHEAGLVHRDVKPENVLIGRTGTPPTGVVKVADFGLVRAVASAGTTSSSIILGTVAYLSPEQVTTGLAGERGDVYSAGIVLYEMLTGRAPYTGDTAISVAYRHVNDDVPAPSTVTPGVPPALDDLVLRATRRDQEARPADAGAFLHELRRIRASLGIGPVTIPVPGDQPSSLPDAERTVPAFAPVGKTSPITGPQGTRMTPRPMGLPSTAVPRMPPPAPPSGPADSDPEGVRRPALIWSIAAVLLVLIGVGIWWVAAGPTSTNSTSVPQVAGLDRASAEKKLTDAGFTVKFTQQRDNTVAAGLAVRSDPTAGSGAVKGSQVTVVLSAGRPTVPDISTSTSLTQAESAIIAAELVPQHDANADQFSTTVPSGNVISVNPQPGTQLDLNSPVSIIVSKGPPPQPVPDVVGLSHDQAFQKLQAAGFEPFDAGTEFSGDVDAGAVTRTSPAANSQVTDGSKRVGVFTNDGVQVPSVLGRSLDDAVQTLQQAGLQADIKGGKGNRGFGFVVDQDPDPGKLVKKGSKVQLRVFP